MRIVIMGAPGSGKGTQAERLCRDHSMPHVSTGDLFRENLSKGTPLGQKAKGYMDAGQLVPDELVLDMLFDRVSKDDCKGGYLLDGFPRTLGQAQALSERLGDESNLTVIDVAVQDETVVERITGRLVCQNCGHIHHRTFSPPAKEGVCDSCGSEALGQRDDDREEVVRERLRVYHEQTAPLVDYYGSRGLLRSVDGEQKPDEVYAAIQGAMRAAG